MKISNIPVGKQIVGLLNHKENQTVADETDICNCNKANYIKLHSNFGIISQVVKQVLQFWKFDDCNKFIDPELMLTIDLVNVSICDLVIVSVYPSVTYVILVKISDKEYKLQWFEAQYNSGTNGVQASPTAELLLAGNGFEMRLNQSYLIVSEESGLVRILSLADRTIVSELQGTAPALVDVGSQWLAVEMGNSNSNHLNGWMSSVTGGKHSGVGALNTISDVSGAALETPDDLLRYAVNGAYHVGKLSWSSVTPYLTSASSHPDAAAAAAPSGQGPVLKGGVIEVVSLSECSSGRVRSVVKFVAHPSSLSAMRFSRDGLRIASSDTSGQVIHVHSLCKPGSTHRGVWDNNSRTPVSYVQLLYKLHRGLTLVAVTGIDFDPLDEAVAVTTNHNSIHVFALPPRCGSVGGESPLQAAVSQLPRPLSDSHSAQHPLPLPHTDHSNSTPVKTKQPRSGGSASGSVTRLPEEESPHGQGQGNPGGRDVVVTSVVNVSKLVHAPRSAGSVGSVDDPSAASHHTGHIYPSTRLTVPERYRPDGDIPAKSPRWGDTCIQSAAGVAGGGSGSGRGAVDYTVLCCTTGGYVSRYSLHRSAPSGGQEEVSPGGSGGQAYSVGSANPAVGSYGSTSSGAGGAGYMDARETNRWDLLTPSTPLHAAYGHATSRPRVGGIEPATTHPVNAAMHQMSWLGVMTSQEAVFHPEQSGVEVNDPGQLVPLWRRHQVSLSTIVPPAPPTAAAPAPAVAAKESVQLPAGTVTQLQYPSCRSQSLYSRQRRAPPAVGNSSHRAVAEAVRSDGIYVHGGSRDLDVSRELFRQKQSEYRSRRTAQSTGQSTQGEDGFFQMEEGEGLGEEDWVSLHTSPSPAPVNYSGK